MKIFYFTATGNSLEVAKSFGGEALSIPKVLRSEDRYFEEDVIGFVIPSYVSSIPTLVEDFIAASTFKANYVFAIVTYGNMILGVPYHFSHIASKHGLRIDYANQIKMVDTSLKYYDMDKQIETLGKKNVEATLEKINRDVQNRVKNKGQGNRLTNQITKLGYKAYRKEIGDCDNLFTVEDHCTKCGVCAKVCPVDNIEVTDTVHFKSKCIRCYACTQNCPVNAIRFEGEKSKSWFRNSQVTLKELIEANS